jgi:hypothetical protein
MVEEKLIILVQGHECLYNLQHKDYDKHLLKDNSWKEIAGELHAQDKELSRRTQHCRRMVGSWQGNSIGTAWERHGMCESGLIVHLLRYAYRSRVTAEKQVTRTDESTLNPIMSVTQYQNNNCFLCSTSLLSSPQIW